MNPPRSVPKRRVAAPGASPAIRPADTARTPVSRQPVKVHLRRTPRLRTIVGVAIGVAGLVLFLVGYIGAASAATHIPGDPHHTTSQLVGLAAAITGFGVAIRRRPTR
jgi:hypothetical protein